MTYAEDYSIPEEGLEQIYAEGLTVFAFPESHRRLIRTTNGLEDLPSFPCSVPSPQCGVL